MDREQRNARRAEFRALKEIVSHGVAVKVVSSPDLFPTPRWLARDMVELADVGCGMLVLEPSAGTGRIVDALANVGALPRTRAIEINPDLARAGGYVCADFLEWEPAHLANESARIFDRVVMNPPFSNGAAIKHVLHARGMVKVRGGRLVALVPGGPREERELRGLCSHWERLPSGSFASEGTNVEVVMLAMDV